MAVLVTTRIWRWLEEGDVLVPVAEGHGLRLEADDLEIGDRGDSGGERVGRRHFETLDGDRTCDGRGDEDGESE